ncbi:MAG: CBS and ACT domain-containing protein [Treponema sp.]|jgi:acetoin utilization protein AcuB|nr:CBS and ACT domain-containing protein [Treponema sp.]
MIISRVMTKNPVYVHPDASVTETRSLMDKENVGHLPVLDKNNTLVGVITREDLIKASPSEATTLDMYEISYLLTKMKVSEIMVKKVITVDENEVVEEAARIMADKDVGCLPVMRGSLLVGIITDTDLFHVFVNAFGARHGGVRFTLSMGEHPGQIAKVSSALAEKGGNIVSLVTAEGDDVAHRRATFKVEGLSREETEAIIQGISDVTLEDIRE